MESPYIMRVDSKGRILIPIEIRNGMKIEEGTKVIVTNGSNGNFSMTPLSKDSTAEVSMMLKELSSIAAVSEALSANSFDVIMSESKRVGKELTEWKMLVDVSGSSERVDILKDLISHVEGVESLDISLK